mmetsp:Transcript_14133/g.21570  ORF Transcript_14133/g.21570 Transcript_14133/m.21570 type:complete len:240 (-) Transcript_14133:58-777(-)|eukprot:CAMPEP_0178913028 /NCGR_PEP_ID=MMETSP0786-20121207/10608_1 /TAXON_ID=186022 /ORGANISM="Thalassionema frauenfeldii, Strain CCMP 1798" /LENGTH=239 /DNA_ID=CAMNT_0020585711 /DNA_START=131 /DNA_END=850 /DNA_ORIENTATION=+
MAVLGNLRKLSTGAASQRLQRGFATGARGARGWGWYTKYRDGRGGRHLQGELFDRDVEELEAINNQVFEMGTEDAYLDIKISDNEEAIHRIKMQLATAAFPLTTKNFLLLCEDGMYTDTIVHRLQKDVGMALGDISMRKGRGGYCHPSLSISGKLPETEPLILSHLPGIVSMTCPGVDKVDSRFILCSHEAPQLDGRFVGFGRLFPESLDQVMQWMETQRTAGGGFPVAEMKIVSCGKL